MPPLRYGPLSEWLSQAARDRPDHPALVAAGTTVTYRELDRETGALSRRLERAPATLPPSPSLDFAIAFHACLRAGFDTVVRTSGTTGAPRPVALSAANHEAGACALGERLGLGPDDRWLCVLPTSHVAGVAIFARAAVFGATVVAHERFNADRVREELAGGAITHVSLVPTTLRRLGDVEAPALRALLLGGAPIPPEQLQLDLPVVPTYGMTETASAVATGSPGEPLPGVELAIGDRDEILVRGPMVAAGAVAADGWLHTSDSGRLDERGRLHVVGRLKEVIVTGGEKVAPARVEAVLEAHPGVREAAAVGVPDAEWGEAVTAVVVGGASESELLAHCRGRLAPFEVPKTFRFVEALPRNAAGKVERDRLRTRVRAR